jgi:hypothetical protein
MKNYLIATVLIFAAGNLCHVGLPWWALAPIAAIVLWFFPQRNGAAAFASGLAAGSMLWGLNALLLHAANGGVFAGKIGQIFQGVSGAQLLYLSSTLGGLLGALGALTGQWAKALTQPAMRRDYYNKRQRSGKYR